MSNAPHPTIPAPRAQWSTLAANLRGVALVAALGAIAGFFAARFMWM